MGINIGGLGGGKVNLILKRVFPSGFHSTQANNLRLFLQLQAEL